MRCVPSFGTVVHDDWVLTLAIGIGEHGDLQRRQRRAAAALLSHRGRRR
jgi:hypothetical protein